MPSSNVVWDIEGSIGTLTFNRPHARNALTWDMYDALVEVCELVDGHPTAQKHPSTPNTRAGGPATTRGGDPGATTVRVLILRGAGEAFAAGTDIAQFQEFAGGDDGVAYERRLDDVIDRLERVKCPTIAVVHGPAVGGGCAIALACDFRICSPEARFGIPIARTLDNCLSVANLARLVDLIGSARAKDLIFSGRLVDAAEAHHLGLATRIVDRERLDAQVEQLAADLSLRAASTIEATKALLQRLRDHRAPAAAGDIIAKCYASDEFREGVRAFVERRQPRWSLRGADRDS